MNKCAQILKQITSNKMPHLTENPVTLIKSITLGSNSIPLPNEQTGLLEEQILAIAERLKIKACYLHAWLSEFYKLN